jgi:hypothetical protein
MNLLQKYKQQLEEVEKDCKEFCHLISRDGFVMCEYHKERAELLKQIIEDLENYTSQKIGQGFGSVKSEMGSEWINSAKKKERTIEILKDSEMTFWRKKGEICWSRDVFNLVYFLDKNRDFIIEIFEKEKQNEN